MSAPTLSSLRAPRAQLAALPASEPPASASPHPASAGLTAPAAPLPTRGGRGAPGLRVLPATPEERRAWDRIRFDGLDVDALQDRPDEDDSPEDSRHIWSPSEPAELPDAATWCGTLVRAAVEVLMGARPAAQLSRWMDADLWTALNRRALLGVRINGRLVRARAVTVRRVHPCAIDPHTWEASVVVHDGERVRAAAVRIEMYRNRWRATALQIG